MSGTGHLRGPQEHEVTVREADGAHTYLLDGRPLQNGSALELRLRGRKGWTSVTVAGLPARLEVVLAAEDGHELRTTLSPGVGLRWA